MKRFHDFCVQFSVCSPFPVSEKLLCYFSVFLADEKLSFPTIKTYLAAVRDAHISLGFPDPRSAGSMPRLERIQAGIRRVQALKGPSKRVRLPITLTILERLGGYWSARADGQVYWAVATLCFFGFFRLGELLSSDASSPHLSWGDVTFDHASEPSIMKVHLRMSKCDQYGKGADVFVGKTGNALCPVAACLAYLTVRGTTEPGAFFLKADRRPLLKPVFVSELRKALGALGLHQAAYAGHSFRIGAATAAAAAGVEDSTIQLMGRWNSAAFLGYIRTPGSQFAAITSRIAQLS